MPKPSCPPAVEPLDDQIAAAMKRGALKQALALLDEAEAQGVPASDLLPQRRRLLVASFVKHRKLGQAHLARQDLDRLAAMPDHAHEKRPALLAALAALLPGTGSGSDAPADRVLLEAVTLAVEGAPPGPARAARLKPEAERTLLLDVARALDALQDVGLPLVLSPAWVRPLLRALVAGADGLDPDGLFDVARAAYAAQEVELARVATALGLELVASQRPRFLLLRAATLLSVLEHRRWMCLRAAVTLARQAGDRVTARTAEDLYQEMLKEGRGQGSLSEPVLRELDLPLAARVVEREAADRSPRKRRLRLADVWWTPFDDEWMQRWEAVDSFLEEVGPAAEVMSRAEARAQAEGIVQERPLPDGVPRELGIALYEALLRFGGRLPDPPYIRGVDPELCDRLEAFQAWIEAHPEVEPPG
jgi:hypothetical protein